MHDRCATLMGPSKTESLSGYRVGVVTAPAPVVDASALPLPGHLLAEHLVREARVLVSPGYQFGPRGVGSFRLCYARDEQEWDMALTRLNAALRSASRS